ncbi:hypothetical protein PF005_g19842 [Phytophthora fragariae]|uniref:RxLR effector protein n=2 Tax=Phytophthora TaxID=4783 RepID=A0A6A4A501_9STRA|nr:hypothetical protein PF003_g36398 [Phytophthora fragariae]KAE8988443.1 hypothetical protein PR002_g21763 [Phytophthora rubi]KAE8927778.1 hypothetical protein PF009_g22063 [Phytophthora fragariae]KAE8985005.1 hypothetical protein PF011_g20560 [Phytophthora fragariae]KAE8991258.1 hypothetical protein PR001_g21276 [Phytophthora rubi]
MVGVFFKTSHLNILYLLTTVHLRVRPNGTSCCTVAVCLLRDHANDRGKDGRSKLDTPARCG